MHIDRRLLDALRKDRIKKRQITHQHSNVSDELSKFLPIIESHIKQAKVETSTNWLLFNDIWIQNEYGHLRNSQYRNYTRGSIIMSLDWGTTNIGTEIRYPHPGVVLYDQDEDWVIAAPITGARIDSNTNQPIPHPPFEVLAFKQNSRPDDANEYWFRKHSVIQVDQIQRISKYRAINKNSYRLRDNLLNQIDNIILQLYIPGKNRLMETLKDELLQKNDELVNALAEIERLRAELSKYEKC